MERTTSSIRLLMDDMLNPPNIAKNPPNIEENIRPPPKQFPTFEAVPTVQPSKQRKMGLKKGGGMKKQRFMGVKARKNKQQAARKPQSFQRFMPMQVMDNQSRKETTSPEALQTIFPLENEVTRSR